MNSKELLEDFLIKTGSKLTTNYKYINDIGYNYYEATPEKTVIIQNHNIPLTKKLSNIQNLYFELKYANLQCILDIDKQMLEAVESGYNNERIAQLADYTINSGKIYISDFLKYAVNKFNPNVKLTSYLISLSATAIETLNNEMIKRLDKYQIKLSTAHMDAINMQTQLNQQTTAEAMAAPQQTYITTQYYDSSSWFNDYSVSYATTTSTMSQDSINASFAANATLSSMLESSGIADAGSGTIKEIGKLIDGIMHKFNEDFTELLIVKLEDLFDLNAYNHVNGIELNPLDLKNWTDILNNMTKEDYEDIKTVTKYYGIDITDYLIKNLSDGEYNYYIENKKCDYQNDRFQLFEDVKGDIQEITNIVSDNIFDYYKAEIYDRPKDRKILKEEINNCTYLLENSKNTLLGYITKNSKYYTDNIIERLIFLIIPIVLLFPVYKFHEWIKYMYDNDIDQFRTSLEQPGDKILACILYAPFGIISLVIIFFVIRNLIKFIKSLKKG